MNCSLRHIKDSEAKGNIRRKLMKYSSNYSFIVIQSPSLFRLFVTPMACSTPGFLAFHCLPEFAQTLVHWVGDAIQPYHPLSSLLLLFSIFPSIKVFSSELALLIRWLKYWSFSFSIGPSNEYSGLISFRLDWLDLLSVQGTLKSLLPTWMFFLFSLKYWMDFWNQIVRGGCKFQGRCITVYLRVGKQSFFLKKTLLHYPVFIYSEQNKVPHKVFLS